MSTATLSQALIAPDKVRNYLTKVFPFVGFTEIRVLQATTAGDPDLHTETGFFDSPSDVVSELEKLESWRGVYFIPNEIAAQELVARKNKLYVAHTTTTDADISRRRWLLVDLDADRESGTNATDEEHKLSLAKAVDIMCDLAEDGWPEPIYGSSGNGAHLIYPIDLPADDGGLVQRTLIGLGCKFDGSGVHVDRVVHNAARIWKLPGTLACKNEHTVERPRRMAQTINFPRKLRRVTQEQLEAIATPKEKRKESPNFESNGSPPMFDVEGFIRKNGLDIARRFEKSGAHYWEFGNSPMCEHDNDRVWIRQEASGKLASRCHHNSCSWGWRDLRAHFDSDYRDRSQQFNGTADNAKNTAASDWPDPQPFESEKLPRCPVEVLPDVLSDWAVAVAEATQTPVDMAVMQAITVCSAAIAGRIDCEVRDGYTEPLNIFTATMMAPGNRKSSVHASATAPLHKYEQELIEKNRSDVAVAASERRVQEKRLAALEKQASGDGEKTANALSSSREIAIWLEQNPSPALPQIITDDATVESLAMVMKQQGGSIASLSAEGGCFDIMAGKYGNQPSFDIFLKGHSGDRFRQTRVSREAIEIERPTLTCGYCLQPHHFEQLSAKGDLRGRGLLARFLYSVPASYIGNRVAAAKAVTQDVQSAYQDVVQRLCVMEATTFQFSNESDIRLREWFDELEPRLGSDGDLQYIADWGGKLVGATVRLAGILHAVKLGDAWQPDTTVEVDTVEASIEIARYLVPHAERAFGMLTGCGNHESIAQELLRRIYGWVADKPELSQVSKRSIHQRVRRQFSANDLDGPLNELVERGWLRRVKQSDKRASPIFDIHPQIIGGKDL